MAEHRERQARKGGGSTHADGRKKAQCRGKDVHPAFDAGANKALEDALDAIRRDTDAYSPDVNDPMFTQPMTV